MLNVLLFIFIYIAGFVTTFRLGAFYAFPLYQLVYFFSPGQRWWSSSIPSLSYSKFTVLLMLVMFFIGFKKYSSNKVFNVPQFKWIYLILITYFIAAIDPILPFFHTDTTINFLKLVIIITIAYKVVTHEKQLKIIVWTYVAGCWYMSFYIFQIGRNAGDRVEGIGTVDAPTSNAIAAALAPSVVLCLYRFWAATSWHGRIFIAVVGAFIANAIVLINSRGSFLAVSVSILYFITYLFFSKMQKKYQKLTVIWIVIFGLSGALYIVDASFIERMSSITEVKKDTEKENAATRTIFWAAAWDMAKDYPLGVGSRGFEYYAPIYIPKNVDTGKSRNRAVHSTWFQALSENGYLGLIFLIALIISCFRANKACKKIFMKSKDIHRYFFVVAIEATLVSFLVSMTFINRYAAEVLFWLILFSACAYNIYVNKKDELDTVK